METTIETKVAGDKDALATAVKAGLEAARALGVSTRSVGAGIWTFSIGMLVASADIEDRIFILEEVARETSGSGFNADSPLEQLGQTEQGARVADADVVAKSIWAYVGPLLDNAPAGADRNLFTYAMAMLERLWGPLHFRRIIADQVLVFAGGEDRILLPHEPKSLNRDKRPVRVVREATPAAPAPSATGHGVPEAIIFARIDADTDGDMSVYAVVSSIASLDRRRREIREVTGRLSDDTGRRAYLQAALDFFRHLGHDGSEVTVETASGLLAEGLVEESRRDRTIFPGEEDIWNELDGHQLRYRVKWRQERDIMGTEIGERCERLLRTGREQEGR